MLLQKKIHITKIENDRSVIERLVDENVAWKLDAYLRKYKEGTKCSLVVTVSGDKKGKFAGSVHLEADGITYRAEREDYKKLDDLVNHLFDHIKEQISKKTKGGLGRIRGIFGKIFSREVDA